MDSQELNPFLDQTDNRKNVPIFGEKNSFSVGESAQSNLFHLENVNAYIGSTHVLKDVSFDIKKNQFIFLIGPTGAGKTSLLNLLAGDLLPSNGVFLFNDQLKNKKVFLSRVFQTLKVFKNQSIKNNLLFSYDANIYQSKEEFLTLADEYLKLFHLSDKLNRDLNRLNIGSHQLVAIVRALLSKPDVLLADEPTSSLDIDTSYKIFEVFNYQNIKNQVSLIWATHDLHLVKKFHGEVLKIDKGRVRKMDRLCFI
jgi:cell division transport system ATP-binding protein